MEPGVNGEAVFCVDCVFTARTKVISQLVQKNINCTVALTVTSSVCSCWTRWIAAVSSCSERVLVSFHEIELGAEMATKFGSIAVLEWVADIIYSRHLDDI